MQCLFSPLQTFLQAFKMSTVSPYHAFSIKKKGVRPGLFPSKKPQMMKIKWFRRLKARMWPFTSRSSNCLRFSSEICVVEFHLLGELLAYFKPVPVLLGSSLTRSHRERRLVTRSDSERPEQSILSLRLRIRRVETSAKVNRRLLNTQFLAEKTCWKQYAVLMVTLRDTFLMWLRMSGATPVVVCQTSCSVTYSEILALSRFKRFVSVQ